MTEEFVTITQLLSIIKKLELEGKKVETERLENHVYVRVNNGYLKKFTLVL